MFSGDFLADVIASSKSMFNLGGAAPFYSDSQLWMLGVCYTSEGQTSDSPAPSQSPADSAITSDSSACQEDVVAATSPVEEVGGVEREHEQEDHEQEEEEEEEENRTGQPQQHPPQQQPQVLPSSSPQLPPHIEAFLSDFRSRIWMTYRKDFPEIDGFTSDAGWGCMCRTAQMMLAQAFILHYLGRGWRRRPDSAPELKYSEIIRCFLDHPQSPYSIHNIIQLGYEHDKKPGEWYGPTSIAQVLHKLFLKHNDDPSLAMYLSNDHTVYIDQVEALCRGGDDGEDWKSVFILIPVRLGLESLNKVYFPGLHYSFSLPQSLGIIGGKPSASFYFMAMQDENMFYLDPHVLRSSIKAELQQPFPSLSFHCNDPKKMRVCDLDPSMALGFYCRTEQEFRDFCARTNQVNKQVNPIWTVADVAPSYHSDEGDCDGSDDDYSLL